jgi:hypothetical protein
MSCACRWRYRCKPWEWAEYVRGIWAWHGGNYGGYDALEVIGKHAFGISRDSDPRWVWPARHTMPVRAPSPYVEGQQPGAETQARALCS